MRHGQGHWLGLGVAQPLPRVGCTLSAAMVNSTPTKAHDHTCAVAGELAEEQKQRLEKGEAVEDLTKLASAAF